MNKFFLLILGVFIFSGCATTLRYTSYTDEQHMAKPKEYQVAVYTKTNPIPSGSLYRIIGKVQIHGDAGDGVRSETLVRRAMVFARDRGADAIINAQTNVIPYGGSYYVPGHLGYYRYHPGHYVHWGDTALVFSGDLIVYAPSN